MNLDSLLVCQGKIITARQALARCVYRVHFFGNIPFHYGPGKSRDGYRLDATGETYFFTRYATINKKPWRSVKAAERNACLLAWEVEGHRVMTVNAKSFNLTVDEVWKDIGVNDIGDYPEAAAGDIEELVTFSGDIAAALKWFDTHFNYIEAFEPLAAMA